MKPYQPIGSKIGHHRHRSIPKMTSGHKITKYSEVGRDACELIIAACNVFFLSRGMPIDLAWRNNPLYFVGKRRNEA